MYFSDQPAEPVKIKFRQLPDGDAFPGGRCQVLHLSEDACRANIWNILAVSSSSEEPFCLCAKPMDAKEIERFQLDFAAGFSWTGQVERDLDGDLLLSVCFFRAKQKTVDSVDIAVDEENILRVRTTLEKNGRNGAKGPKNVEELIAFLSEEFVLERNDGSELFFLSTGEDEWEEPEEEPSDSESELFEAVAPESFPTDFRLIGRRYEAAIARKPAGKGREIYILSKFHKRRKKGKGVITPVTGVLRFRDKTHAQRCFLASAALIAARAAGSDYLDTWKRFGEIEGDIRLAEARAFGVVYFKDPVQARSSEEGTTVTVTGTLEPFVSERLRKGDGSVTLRLVDAEPPYLRDENYDFERYREDLRQEDRSKEGTKDFDVLGFDPATRALKLATQRDLPGKGMLVLSLFAEAIQTVRRNNAWRKLNDADCPNPNLALVLEDKAEMETRPRAHELKLSDQVRRKVFAHRTTPAQEEAVRIALNTPDIALIQGPPGTGKTTVIAAIVERLNELSSGSEPHRVLLTGFQHVAVENMIGRISLNGIPVPKAGGRSDDPSVNSDAFRRQLQSWTENLALALRETYRLDENALPAMGEVETNGVQYLLNPTQAAATKLAKMIRDHALEKGDDALASEAKAVVRSLANSTGLSGDEEKIRAVRRLRTTAEGFADDGPDRAYEALSELSDGLTKEERSLLEEASDWMPSQGTPSWLSRMSALKEALFLRLTQPPAFSIARRNADVTGLFKKFLESGKRYRAKMTPEEKKIEAVKLFLSRVRENPETLVEAIGSYSYAIAATCQQSVNKTLMRGFGRIVDRDFAYDYVIVDEAARVMPRDLLIAFAQGRRVILVGDHRQLPHIVDELAAKKLEEDRESPRTERLLKQSLFEYLFTERLPDIEAGDGILRHVTLDRQFRMHPVLGDFVSRNFYERFNASERLSSGLGAEVFRHNLPETDGRPAVWIDVPHELGPKVRRGTSYIRAAEIKAIRKILTKWLQSPEGRDLTFGVIAFYRAQAVELEKQLAAAGISADRVKVGTVDAFQGMEFDVVILSMVRSEAEPAECKTSADESEKGRQGRKTFGHLCLYNRLNVAMSRQKRLLVVAGDSAMVKTKLAEYAVPGLVDFYRLASREGVVIPMSE